MTGFVLSLLLIVAFPAYQDADCSEYSVEQYLELGRQAFLDDSDYETALEHYNCVIQLDPENSDGYWGRGFAQLALEAYADNLESGGDAAMTDGETALLLSESEDGDYVTLGLLYFSFDVSERGIDTFSTLIEKYPDKAILYAERGMHYELLGEDELAENDTEIALDLDPDIGLLYISHGLWFDEEEPEFLNTISQERILVYLNRVIRFVPDMPEPYINRGIYYFYVSEYDLALADFDLALEIDSTGTIDAQIYINKGLVYDELEDYEQSIEMYSKAIELDPEIANTYTLRAFAYIELLEVMRAIQDLETAAELDPGNPLVLAGLGGLYLMTSRYEETVEMFEQVVDIMGDETPQDVNNTLDSARYQLEQ